jgi:hypothetical protein
VLRVVDLEAMELDGQVVLVVTVHDPVMLDRDGCGVIYASDIGAYTLAESVTWGATGVVVVAA